MLAVMAIAIAGSAFAFDEIPKASAKALGVTRGKPFDSGLVFINGKYIAPPYVVERWGTGLRINGIQATGQLVDWNDFLKTQDGVKVTRTETAPVVMPSAVADEKDVDDESSSLDDLFDDDPKPKRKLAPKQRRAQIRKPSVTAVYSFDGDFVANETTKIYVKKMNAARSKLDSTLRMGSFVFFGDRYARVSGGDRMAMDLIGKLPELMRDCQSSADLASRVRGANIAYLTEVMCEDLYRNRIDYRSLQERRVKMKKEHDFKKMLNGSAF